MHLQKDDQSDRLFSVKQTLAIFKLRHEQGRAAVVFEERSALWIATEARCPNPQTLFWGNRRSQHHDGAGNLGGANGACSPHG